MDDHENEIFPIRSSARVAGKCDRRRHSTASLGENVVVAKTSY